MNVAAVLFDMDGTLVDSIPAWHKTFNMALAETGGDEVSLEEFRKDILGQSTEADVERFFPKLSVDELITLYDRLFPKNILEVRLYPESTKVLDYLDGKGVLKAIVTNTPRNLMNHTLDRLKITDRFDVVLGGDEVAVGKPEPDIIVKACEKLCVKPEETLMVGDTKADMEAGKKANVKTIGIGVKGDIEVESIGEVVDVLQQMAKS